MKTEKPGTFKIRCVKLPDNHCIYKDITIGHVYVGLWRDGDDTKLKRDDKGMEGYYYNTDLFEIVPFETELSGQESSQDERPLLECDDDEFLNDLEEEEKRQEAITLKYI